MIKFNKKSQFLNQFQSSRAKVLPSGHQIEPKKKTVNWEDLESLQIETYIELQALQTEPLSANAIMTIIRVYVVMLSSTFGSYL